MRYLTLKIMAVFCVLIASFFGCKWQTWFGNPAEATYTTSSIPNRIMLSLGEDADFDRAISWRCDTLISKAFTRLVEHATQDTLNIEASGTIVSSLGGKSAFYRSDIKNLRTGNYSYQVVNGEKESAWQDFSIGKKDDSLSFLYLGDIQDEIDGLSDTIFSHINKKYPNLDFWNFVGDNIERPMDIYWDEFYSSGENIFNKMPIISCPGNHEYYKAFFKILDDRWIHYWPLPKNGPKFFKGRACHWEIENACIISIDTDGVQGIGTYFSQFYWAKDILENTDKKWKIVFLHHPLRSAGEGRSTLIIKTLFNNMLIRNGVDLVLQGHDHSYSRYTNKEDGIQKIPAYIESACSHKFYDIIIDDEADRLGSSLKLYQIIDIKGDKLTFKSYTIDDVLYDAFSIENKDNKKIFIDEKPNTLEKLEPTEKMKSPKNKSKLKSYYKDVEKRHKRK